MGIFWDLPQENKLEKQQEQAESIEEQVELLEKELETTKSLPRKTLEVLETLINGYVDGDGITGAS